MPIRSHFDYVLGRFNQDRLVEDPHASTVSMRDIARDCRMSRNTIDAVRFGNPGVKLGTLERLCEYFGLSSISELVEYETVEQSWARQEEQNAILSKRKQFHRPTEEEAKWSNFLAFWDIEFKDNPVTPQNLVSIAVSNGIVSKSVDDPTSRLKTLLERKKGEEFIGYTFFPYDRVEGQYRCFRCLDSE
jgi:transcriptional regulator with XRE-family HTH domain